MRRDTLLGTKASGWTVLIRLIVGLVVFFPEGLQKLFFPDVLGAGRFAAIGIPYPKLMGPFVGMVETICGTLVIVGLATRLAAIPLIVIMTVAIISTKLPILLGRFELVRIGGEPTAGVMKDVVMLGGFQEVEVDFVANNPGLTLFHCHQQLHMDFGFMALLSYA